MTDKQPEALRMAELLEAIGALEAADELRRLHQVDVAHGWWLDKTEWVQESSEAEDLGRHRADVMKQRIDRLHDENEALRAALEQSQAVTNCHQSDYPQGEQEPVAWLTIEVMGPRTRVDVEWEDQLQKLPSGIYKLYTNPQPKSDASGKPDEWFDRLKAANIK